MLEPIQKRLIFSSESRKYEGGSRKTLYFRLPISDFRLAVRQCWRFSVKDFSRGVCRTLAILCLLGLSWTAAFAQRPNISTGTRPTGVEGNDQQGVFGSQRESQPDTFGIFAFTVDNPNEERPFADTLLTEFQHYDPARNQPVDYRHLGILGSAAEPIRYLPRLRNGLDLGWHQYDLYRLTGHNMNYYRLERPYTILNYVQGSEQADGYLTARFSRNFADGLNFSIDYSRITQIGELDQYPNQHNRVTAVGAGLWFHSQNDRYDGFLSFTSNTVEQQDNGGVLTLPVLDGEFESPSSAEVFLTDARTRYAERELMYTHYYRFGGRTDTLGRSSRAFTLSHQFTYHSGAYKFYDAFALSDTNFYHWFPALLPEPRGNRYFVQQRMVENSFRISTYQLADSRRQTTTGRTQRDLLQVGLTHRYNDIYLEPIDTTINNLLLTGQVGFRLGDRLRLQADGQLALLDQVGDWRVSGELTVDLGAVGELVLTANNQLYSPTLLQDRFFLSQQLVWDNAFRKTLESNIGGAYRFPRWDISVGGRYHLINNLIYFDTTGLPAQTGVPLSIAQLEVRKDFRLGAFHLDNTLVLQQASEDFIRLPTLFGTHSLYYAGRWFRVLRVQFGLDARYMTAHRARYYNPVTGQFQLQDRQLVPFYPNVDGYVSLSVTRFRAFLKWENMTSMLQLNTGSELLYLTAYYPFPDAALRFGISWRMLD